LSSFMASTFPASGPAIRSKRCLYTLTPDRDFVLSTVPGNENIVVGLGAAHGFKFAPTFGRLLTDLVVNGRTTEDISAFELGRDALTDPDYAAHWMV
jgi:sarcosine oxidase